MSFKKLLQRIMLEATFAASAEGPAGAWRSGHEASLMLTRALQHTDLEWVGRHRSKLRGAAGIDVRLTWQIVQKLPARGPREALASVLVGDMVVRHLTKHWQPRRPLPLRPRRRDRAAHLLGVPPVCRAAAGLRAGHRQPAVALPGPAEGPS